MDSRFLGRKIGVWNESCGTGETGGRRIGGGSVKRGLLLILGLIVLALTALFLVRDRKPGPAPNTIDMESRKKLERVIEEAETEIDRESKGRLEKVLEEAQTKGGSGEQP